MSVSMVQGHPTSGSYSTSMAVVRKKISRFDRGPPPNTPESTCTSIILNASKWSINKDCAFC